MPSTTRWTAITAAAVGAVIGSKLLFLVENPTETAQKWSSLTYVMGGKTIVGGLIGGLLAVEWVKQRIGEKRSTGDLFVMPLIVGMCVGRVGCFLTGLDDGTFGTATTLAWGVDFGDGVRRHPTQLYEIVFLLLLGAILFSVRDRLPKSGDTFKIFMSAYLGWRFAIGFLQPDVPLFGLTAIQWACLGTMFFYAEHFRRRISGTGTAREFAGLNG